MKRLILTILLTTLAAGCQTAPKSRYGDVNDDVYGDKRKMEYTQQIQALEEVVGKLNTDPDFDDVYEEALARAESRGHKRPTVLVDKIEDNTQAGSNDYETAQMRTELKTALRKTRLFRIIDLQERELMRQSVIVEADGGARGDNLESVGEYDASDFTMRGAIVRKPIGGVWFHCLNLLMVDTSSGDVVWSDTVKLRKE